MQVPNNSGGVGLCFIDGSNVPVTVTGTTSEVEVGRVTIPAGAFGTAGLLRLAGYSEQTNNANAKTLRLRLGSIAGAIICSTGILVSNLRYNWGAQMWVRDNLLYAPFNMTTWFQGATGVIQQAVDWKTDTDLVLTMQLANGADSFTLGASLWEGVRF